MYMFRRRTSCGSPGLRCARLCVENSNDDGTGGEGRGGVRGAESKSYIRYSTRLESSQASVAVFLQDSLLFSAPHCALRSAHCNVHGLGRPSSQDEDQAESGYIGTYVHMYVRCHSRTSGSESAGSLLLSS